MNFDFTRAMREAASLTRAQKLTEATRVIQGALLSTRQLNGTLPSTEPSGERQSSNGPHQIEHAPLADGPSGSSDRWRASGEFGKRLKIPLGDVVKILRQAKLRRLPRNPLAGIKVSSAPKIPEGAQYLTRSFTCPAGTRIYKLYIPRRRAEGLPLIVMLHGCTQDPDDFAMGTRMNSLAEEFGFLVAYPSQPAAANPSLCWNWFQPRDQVRGAGEPSIIAGLTTDIVATYDLNPKQIFVAGLSAGGAMAAVLGATYPDLYCAIGVHSGLAFKSASDVVSAFAAMRGDPISGRDARAWDAKYTSRIRAIVFHGDADQTVHPSNAEKLAAGYGGQQGEVREVASGQIGGHPYTRTVVQGQSGCRRMELWMIGGAGHAWSGGSMDGSFTDAAGPDASREMVRFFLEEPGNEAP